VRGGRSENHTNHSGNLHVAIVNSNLCFCADRYALLLQRERSCCGSGVYDLALCTGGEVTELKPCPWCYDTDLDCIKDVEWMASQYYVWCKNCAVCGPIADSEDEAKRLWNDRFVEGNDAQKEKKDGE